MVQYYYYYCSPFIPPCTVPSKALQCIKHGRAWDEGEQKLLPYQDGGKMEVMYTWDVMGGQVHHKVAGFTPTFIMYAKCMDL